MKENKIPYRACIDTKDIAEMIVLVNNVDATVILNPQELKINEPILTIDSIKGDIYKFNLNNVRIVTTDREGNTKIFSYGY